MQLSPDEMPEGVLAHPNGRIYVAGAWSGNVVAYEQGKKVLELTGLSSPHDLELAANSNIWLADSGNHRVLLLSPELKIKRELARETYDFNGVRYLDVMPDGTLIAADSKGSIHQVGAACENAPSCNGWTYWCFKRDGKTVPIDVLRQQIRSEMS